MLSKSPILILSVMPGKGHGAEKVLTYFLEGGAERLRHQIVVAAPPDSEVFSIAQEQGYTALEWPSLSAGLRTNLRALTRFLIKDSPDFALIHAWQADAFEAAAGLGALKGVSVCGTIHDSVQAYYGNPTPDLNYHTYRKFIWAHATRSMKSIATPSEATAQDWRINFGVEATGIGNGAPDRQILKRIDRPPFPIQIGFLGCYTGWKGLGTLAPLVKGTRDLPLHWNLYGMIAPELKAYLDHLLTAYGDRVTYHGYQSTDHIFPQLDLVIHPSTRHDPFPTVLLETARAGLPALASNVGGTAEIIADGESGLLFENGDAPTALAKLRRVASNRNLLEMMGTAARTRYLQNFQASMMVARYECFWNQVLQKN